MPPPSTARASGRALGALLAALCLAPAAARAAGFYFPDLGPRQLGRSVTGVAGLGDLSALVYNPAGLALLPEQGSAATCRPSTPSQPSTPGRRSRQSSAAA